MINDTKKNQTLVPAQALCAGFVMTFGINFFPETYSMLDSKYQTFAPIRALRQRLHCLLLHSSCFCVFHAGAITATLLPSGGHDLHIHVHIPCAKWQIDGEFADCVDALFPDY